jgi:hypothetical protein
MPKLKSSNHGARFMSHAEARVIGGCLQVNCPGELVTGTAAGEPVITCDLCGVIWPVLMWPSLRIQLEGHAA